MAREPMLIDGKRSLGCEFPEYVHGEEFSTMIRLHGGRLPSITDCDMAAVPAWAEVNHGRWITQCPQPRCPGTSLVWIGGPHIFMCLVCCNLGILGRYRRVIIPDNLEEIEAILFARHIYTERNWIPTMTVDDLLLENHQLGYMIPVGFEERAEVVVARHQEYQAELERLAEAEAANIRDVSHEEMVEILANMPAIIPVIPNESTEV